VRKDGQTPQVRRTISFVCGASLLSSGGTGTGGAEECRTLGAGEATQRSQRREHRSRTVPGSRNDGRCIAAPYGLTLLVLDRQMERTAYHQQIVITGGFGGWCRKLLLRWPARVRLQPGGRELLRLIYCNSFRKLIFTLRLTAPPFGKASASVISQNGMITAQPVPAISTIPRCGMPLVICPIALTHQPRMTLPTLDHSGKTWSFDTISPAGPSCGQRRRTYQVSEHHRHLPALGSFQRLLKIKNIDTRSQ
jgi:hypothetical protein